MQGMKERNGETASERNRVEAVVQTLATVHGPGNSAAELAHDARNMVTALALYCDLLEEPGVLTPSFLHYGSELRLVVAASRRLVEKLVLLDSRQSTVAGRLERTVSGWEDSQSGRGYEIAGDGHATYGAAPQKQPDAPIDDLRQELLENRNLLDAIAGLAISVTVEAEGGSLPVALTGEDLTRVLVNLVKNSAEAIRTAGSVRIVLREKTANPGTTQWVELIVEDSGPGIPKDLLETIFETGFTTRRARVEMEPATGSWMAGHRGLGLSISRSIVEAAGGRICAESGERGGARIQIELPVRVR